MRFGSTGATETCIAKIVRLNQAPHKSSSKILSIVIPALNEERYLPLLLQDIIKNKFVHSRFEIVVSDSGSTDNTEKVVRSFASKHPKLPVIFVVANKKGVSIARINGAAVAKGKYLFFLDADTRIPDRQFLSKAVEEMEARKLDVAGIYPDVDSPHLADQALCRVFVTAMKVAEHTDHPGVAGGAGIIAKKALHNEIGGFDPAMNLGEDVDYTARAAKKGNFALLNNVKTIFHDRRFKKEGRAALVFKYTVAGICTLLGIKKIPLQYEVGHFGKKE